MEKVFGYVKTVVSFIIVVCGKCEGLLVAKVTQKTKLCAYCGFRMTLDRSKRVAVANDAVEAIGILKKLKKESAEKRRERSLP